MTYKNLEQSVNKSFEDIKELKDGVDATSIKINSKVVSVVVSNPSTQSLSHPVTITFRNLNVISHFSVSFLNLYIAWNLRMEYKEIKIMMILFLYIRKQQSLLKWSSSVHIGMTKEPGQEMDAVEFPPMPLLLSVNVYI